ncbi:unnamed protein product [Amoebophrya sp. A120]|nr:unnamed protein product [Amoebophrya sp. A120]|eukprot:GSA120T00006492001.1
MRAAGRREAEELLLMLRGEREDAVQERVMYRQEAYDKQEDPVESKSSLPAGDVVRARSSARNGKNGGLEDASAGRTPLLHEEPPVFAHLQSLHSDSFAAVLARLLPLLILLTFVVGYVYMYLTTYVYGYYPLIWFEYAVLPSQALVLYHLVFSVVGAWLCVSRMAHAVREDWNAKLQKFAQASEENEKELDGLLHVVILPNYKEDEETLSATITNLVLQHCDVSEGSRSCRKGNAQGGQEDSDENRSCLNSSPSGCQYRLPMVLVLAMEGREGGEAVAKAERLQARHGHQFEKILVSYHQKDEFPGEIAGKSSNSHAGFLCAKAFLNDPLQCVNISLDDEDQRRKPSRARVGAPRAANNADTSAMSDKNAESRLWWHPARTFFTVADADTLFHRHYFACLTLTALSEKCADREWKIWQSVQLPFRNYLDVPALSKLAAVGAWLHEHAQLGLYTLFPAVPMSSYSLTYALADRVGGWDVDVIAEDCHMYLKCLLVSHLWSVRRPEHLADEKAVDGACPAQESGDHLPCSDAVKEREALLGGCKESSGQEASGPRPGGGTGARSSSSTGVPAARGSVCKMEVVSIDLPFANFIVESDRNSYLANIVARMQQARRHLQGIAEASFLLLNVWNMLAWRAKSMQLTIKSSPSAVRNKTIADAGMTPALEEHSIFRYVKHLRIASSIINLNMLVPCCAGMGAMPGLVRFLHGYGGFPLIMEALPITYGILSAGFGSLVCTHVFLFVSSLRQFQEGHYFPVWQLGCGQVSWSRNTAKHRCGKEERIAGCADEKQEKEASACAPVASCGTDLHFIDHDDATITFDTVGNPTVVSKIHRNPSSKDYSGTDCTDKRDPLSPTGGHRDTNGASAAFSTSGTFLCMDAANTLPAGNQEPLLRRLGKSINAVSSRKLTNASLVVLIASTFLNFLLWGQILLALLFFVPLLPTAIHIAFHGNRFDYATAEKPKSAAAATNPNTVVVDAKPAEKRQDDETERNENDCSANAKAAGETIREQLLQVYLKYIGVLRRRTGFGKDKRDIRTQMQRPAKFSQEFYDVPCCLHSQVCCTFLLVFLFVSTMVLAPALVGGFWNLAKRIEHSAGCCGGEGAPSGSSEASSAEDTEAGKLLEAELQQFRITMLDELRLLHDLHDRTTKVNRSTADETLSPRHAGVRGREEDEAAEDITTSSTDIKIKRHQEPQLPNGASELSGPNLFSSLPCPECVVGVGNTWRVWTFWHEEKLEDLETVFLQNMLVQEQQVQEHQSRSPREDHGPLEEGGHSVSNAGQQDHVVVPQYQHEHLSMKNLRVFLTEKQTRFIEALAKFRDNVTRRPRWNLVSDWVRFLLIYNYGGLFLDLSIVLTQPLADWLPRRFADGVTNLVFFHAWTTPAYQLSFPLARGEENLPWFESWMIAAQAPQEPFVYETLVQFAKAFEDLRQDQLAGSEAFWEDLRQAGVTMWQPNLDPFQHQIYFAMNAVLQKHYITSAQRGAGGVQLQEQAANITSSGGTAPHQGLHPLAGTTASPLHETRGVNTVGLTGEAGTILSALQHYGVRTESCLSDSNGAAKIMQVDVGELCASGVFSGLGASTCEMERLESLADFPKPLLKMINLDRSLFQRELRRIRENETGQIDKTSANPRSTTSTSARDKHVSCCEGEVGTKEELENAEKGDMKLEQADKPVVPESGLRSSLQKLLNSAAFPQQFARLQELQRRAGGGEPEKLVFSDPSVHKHTSEQHTGIKPAANAGEAGGVDRTIFPAVQSRKAKKHLNKKKIPIKHMKVARNPPPVSGGGTHVV